MALKSWWEVFPHGTREGDEENRFFCALARHSDKWRSVSDLSVQTQLPKARVEEMIAKYAQEGMIYNNPKDPDEWGYWERVGERKKEKDLFTEDHEVRFKKN